MPTAIAEPTLAELLQAFRDGVRAQRDPSADVREGSVYDYWGGVAAILWRRNALRDTDLWRAVYFASAEGADLTALLADRYGFDRVPDAYGVGSATLRRATAIAGAGTVWQGTRIVVPGVTSLSRQYVVAVDEPVEATGQLVEVAIRADRPGPGTAIRVDSGAARLLDPLWDPTWEVISLTCADGTAFEPAPAARARLRDARSSARPGFVEAIVAACRAAGAETALLFPSDYAGEASDAGLNMVYVGDAGYQGSEAMCRRIAIALEGARVLGDQTQVRPLTRTALVFAARVHLWGNPTRVAQPDLHARLHGAVRGYFESTTDGFSYQRDAIAGAMMKAAPEVQTVDIATPASDAAVVSLIDGALNFPAVLPRYSLAPNDITLELLPPI